MIKIVLKDNENGYDEVGKVVDKFVEKYGVGSIIVKLVLAYSPEETPNTLNELLFYEGFNTVDQSPIIPHEGFLWEYDWWEGQKYITIVAMDFIEDVIISGSKLKQIEKEDNITEEQYQKALKILAECIYERTNLPRTEKEDKE